MSSTAPLSSPLRNFPHFPLLPLELRLKVWQYTSVPRHIIWDQEDNWSSPPLCTTNPAIHANHEARTTILSLYTLVESKSMGDECAGTWINFEIDTLCMVLAFGRLDRLLRTQSPILDRVKLLELERLENSRFPLLKMVRKQLAATAGSHNVEREFRAETELGANIIKTFFESFEAVTHDGSSDVMSWIRAHWWKA